MPDACIHPEGRRTTLADNQICEDCGVVITYGDTVRRLQQKAGTPVDGQWGPITITTMQVHTETEYWSALEFRREIVRLRLANAKYRAALTEIRDQSNRFEDRASEVFGGDSEERLWAWGLGSFIDEQIREDNRG